MKKYYGLCDFRPGQQQLIEAILSGRDSLGVLPTGGGKSLCYQLPAIIGGGLVVVISPLIALMEDQVRRLDRKGITAVCLHAGLDQSRREKAYKMLSNKALRLLYLAPERLQNRNIRLLLREKTLENKLIAIAVDEAHCVSAWGHDFRPDYLRLGEVRQLCTGVPVIALSATAPPRVRADIIRSLRLRQPVVKVCSAKRENLGYQMRRRPSEPLQEVLQVLKDARGARLIYARTRRSVETWSNLLQTQGVEAIPYHAGLDPFAREKALLDFLNKDQPVLVATVAFGMGVDRPDVGLVLHLNMPSSPEGYLQESGRAGRDGLPAKCLVLFSPGDRIRLVWAMKASFLRKKEGANNLRLERACEQIRRMEAIAEGGGCREQALLFEIGEISQPCGRCDRCLNLPLAKDCSEEAFALLSELRVGRGLGLSSLSASLKTKNTHSKEEWGWLARRLVQEDLIGEINDGSQHFYLKDGGHSFLLSPWPLLFAS